MAPSAKLEALVSNSNCHSGSGAVSSGSSVTLVMSLSKASWHSLVHLNGTPFFVKLVRGLARSANPWMKGHW